MIFVCMPTRSSPEMHVWKTAQAACEEFGEAKLLIPRETLCVANIRTKCADQMLNNSIYTHLMFIDDDVAVPRDTIAVLDRMDANVAVGCYPTMRHGKMIIAVQRQDRQWTTGWFSGIRETPRAGAGCMLIKRKVFEELPHPWFKFEQLLLEGRHHSVGEDMAFCRDVTNAGLGPILANGDVRCSHFKMIDMASLTKPEYAA